MALKEKLFKEYKYKTFGAFLLFLVLIWSTLFFYSIHRMLPSNPLKIPFEDQLQTDKWFPQRWEFYSRDARSDLFLAYNKDGSLAANWPNSSVKNVFGIYRYGRSQGVELGLLSQIVPEESYIECESGYANCTESLTSHKVVNPLEYPTICGQVDIVLEEPIPWAWSKNKDMINMPSKIARLDISCLKN